MTAQGANSYRVLAGCTFIVILSVLSAVRSFFTQSINWSGVRYHLRKGKISKIERSKKCGEEDNDAKLRATGSLASFGRASSVPDTGWRLRGVIVAHLPTHVAVNASMSATARPLVYVAAGCNEVSLWNAENGNCNQVWRVANNDSEAETYDVPWALARPTKSNPKQDLRRNINPEYGDDQRATATTAGSDSAQGSAFGIASSCMPWPDPVNKSVGLPSSVIAPKLVSGSFSSSSGSETRSSFGVQVVQETSKRPQATKMSPKSLLTAAATESAGCHRDSVLSLASVKLNQILLI